MTPAELSSMVAAQHERDDTEWLRVAFLACAVRTSVWGSDPITPYSLLGKPDPAVPSLATDAKQDELWDRALRMCRPRHGQ